MDISSKSVARDISVSYTHLFTMEGHNPHPTDSPHYQANKTKDGVPLQRDAGDLVDQTAAALLGRYRKAHHQKKIGNAIDEYGLQGRIGFPRVFSQQYAYQDNQADAEMCIRDSPSPFWTFL